jgi:acetoin utilization protein AcuB
MSRPVLTIGPGASGHEAITRMCQSRIRHLPVIGTSGEVLGVITDRDLRHHLFTPGIFERIGPVPIEQLLRETPVGQIMSTPAFWILGSADLSEAAALMRDRKVGSLPVIEGGRVTGILTEIDLLRHICGDVSGLPELDIVVSYP